MCPANRINWLMNQKEIKSTETENRGDTLKVMGLRPWTHDNNPATIEETLCKQKNRARLLSPIAPITGAVAGDDDDEPEHSEERTRNTGTHVFWCRKRATFSDSIAEYIWTITVAWGHDAATFTLHYCRAIPRLEHPDRHGRNAHAITSYRSVPSHRRECREYIHHYSYEWGRPLHEQSMRLACFITWRAQLNELLFS